MADERDKMRARMGLPPLPSTPAASAVVPGSANDPFYQSTGVMKDVTLPDGRTIRALDVGSTKPPAATTVGMISPSSGLTITGTERNVVKEAEARAIGYTKEYIASRGGINTQGYFNDTPTSGQLTAEEQRQVRLPNGNTNTSAMAAILIKKQYDEAVGSGASPADTVRKLQGQYGNLFDSSVLPASDMAGLGGDLGSGLSGLSFFGDLPNANKNDSVESSTGLSTGLPFTSTPGPVLAKDVFKTTLGLFFGDAEMKNPWVNELYKSMSKYYKTGATIDESYNLSIQDVRNNPEMAEFTKRFKGIYDLQDLKQTGKPVTVPTIAEYFGTQTKLGDILRAANLSELATEDYINSIIGKAIPASVFAERITQVFDRIDFAPNEIKETIKTNFPYLTRTQLAKAIIGGEKSTKELQREIAGYEILTAAQQQGLAKTTALPGGVTIERATELGALGETYSSTLGKFGRVAQALPEITRLSYISNKEPLTQASVENLIFRQSAEEAKKIEQLTKEEDARFLGKSGTLGSKSLASQARASQQY